MSCEIANCGADTPEMKYSGHTRLYHHHFYIHFGPINKLHYEGGCIIHTLCSVLEIFTNEGSHTKSWFKSGGTASRIGMFSTNISVQLYLSISNKRSQNQRGSAVTEIFLIQAWECLEWRFHGDSKSLSPIRRANRLCRCLKVSNRSGNTKRGSNAISGCRNNWETLCSYSDCEERRPVSKIAVSDSRGWIFSAFVGLGGCRIGSETRNRAQMRSADAEMTEKHCSLAHRKCYGQERRPVSQAAVSHSRNRMFSAFVVLSWCWSVWKHEMGLKCDRWLPR